MTAPSVLLPRRATPVARRGLLGHSPALDGLRGLALVLVLIYHFTGVSGPLPGGWAGVDVFFVLSGFLITALLLDERRLHGRVALGRFYARRALRLLPALLVMLTVWCVLLLAFHNSSWLGAVPNGGRSGHPVAVLPALGHVALVLTYGINWVHALGQGWAPLGHLWSLAIEEQFYLVWPFTLLVFLRLPSGRRVWPVFALAATSAVLPFFLYDGGAGKNRIYFGTDTRAVGLLLGAAAALLWHRRRAASRVAPAAAVRAYLGLAFVGAVGVYLANLPVKFLVAPALLGVAVAQVVPYLVDHPTSLLSRVMSFRWLVWVGRRSYALYLWHYLWATWTHPLPLAYSMPLGVAGALVCTLLSWRYVEAPCLRYAKRFRVEPPQPVALDPNPQEQRFNQPAPPTAPQCHSPSHDRACCDYPLPRLPRHRQRRWVRRGGHHPWDAGLPRRTQRVRPGRAGRCPFRRRSHKSTDDPAHRGLRWPMASHAHLKPARLKRMHNAAMGAPRTPSRRTSPCPYTGCLR